MVSENPEQDLEALDRLNRILVPRGISLQARQSGKGISVDIVSLGGLEYCTHLSRQLWMIPFRKESDWPGYLLPMEKGRVGTNPSGTDKSV